LFRVVSDWRCAEAVAWVRLQLDTDAFDDAQFVPYLRRCQQAGIDFTTLVPRIAGNLLSAGPV